MSTSHKVLIVEDDDKITKALTARLKSVGYEIVAAADATTGIAAAVREQPDLILLDITMPAGGGFFVAEKLKMNPRTASVPVVFITASKARGIRERAEELGAAAFLEKPFKSDALLETLYKLLNADILVGDERFE